MRLRSLRCPPSLGRRYLHHPEAYPRSDLRRLHLDGESRACARLRRTVRDILARTPTLYTGIVRLAEEKVRFALVTDCENVQLAAEVYANGPDNDTGDFQQIAQFQPPFPPWMRASPPGPNIIRTDPDRPLAGSESQEAVRTPSGSNDDPFLLEMRRKFSLIGEKGSLSEPVALKSSELSPLKTLPGYRLPDLFEEAWDSPVRSTAGVRTGSKAVDARPKLSEAFKFLEAQESYLLGTSNAETGPSSIPTTLVIEPEITSAALSENEDLFYSTLLQRAHGQLDSCNEAFSVVVLTNWSGDPAFRSARDEIERDAGTSKLKRFSYFDEQSRMLYILGTNNPVDFRECVASAAAGHLSNRAAGILTVSAVVSSGAASSRRSARPSLICGFGASGGTFWGHHHILGSEGIKPFWYGETWTPRFVAGDWKKRVSFGRDLVEGSMPWPDRVTGPCLNACGREILEHPGMIVIVHEFGKQSANVYHCFSAEEAAFYFLISNCSPAIEREAQYDDALRFGMYVEALKIPVWLVMGHKAAHVALRVASGQATGGGKVGRTDRARSAKLARTKYGDMITVHHVDHLQLPRVSLPSLLDNFNEFADERFTEESAAP